MMLDGLTLPTRQKRAGPISANGIRELRKRLGLSQARFAALLTRAKETARANGAEFLHAGISKATVTLWETGKRTPSEESRRLLAELRHAIKDTR